MNNLESAVYAAETLRQHSWNPLVYNAGDARYAFVARDFAPRQQTVYRRAAHDG